MDRRAILDFAHRDWARVAGAKSSAWRRRKQNGSAAEILALGDQLRRYAQTVRPDWPRPDERAADLATHVRVAERLHAASLRRTR